MSSDIAGATGTDPTPHPAVTERPGVTVIMPVRNEEAFIARSLGAVLGQDYPPELMQVLVADGMSDDRTREVVAELARAHPAHSVEIVDNPGGIVPTGFNAALDRARGDVVVRVDGHTIIASDYVGQCVAALAASGADNVGGRMDAEGSGPVGTAIALATSSPFGVGDSQFHYATGEHWVDTVYLGAWPREVFGRIGPFDPEMVRNQDDEFNYRLRAAGGRMDAEGSGPVATAIALATSSPFGVGDSQFHYATGEHWVDTVYLGAWPREVFGRVGRFDPEMVRNQDDEFNYRLRSAGGRILLTDRIRSRYYSRASLRTLFRQYRQYGTWKVRVLQKHPRQMSARQFVPPTFAAVVGGGALLAPLSPVVRRAWLAALGSYGLATLAASVTIARRHGWRHLPVLPAAFAAVHLGYGSGFLAGLVRFRRRWGDRGYGGGTGTTRSSP